MKWIDINKQTPVWYANVELKLIVRNDNINSKLEDNCVIRHNWHRLSNGDETYYGSLETDEIIYETEVSHWRPLKDKKYE